MSDAKITVAVPSFNQGRFLDHALRSIFEQDLAVEVFVMDGGSTDNSVDIIKQWEHKLAGWSSGPDDGQAAAINEGIKRGSAPYVCWLNSDDYFFEGGLKQLLDSLQEHPARPFVYSRCWTVSETGKKLMPYLTPPFSRRLFANFCFIAQPATLITRTAWKQVDGLNADMQMAFDYDLWWRLYRTFGEPEYCKKFTAATRMHKDTKTANRVELHYKESIDTVKTNYGALPLKWHIFLPFMKLVRKYNK